MSKVSVIVPVYNVEQYIKRCLKSILDQSWQDFEILCVDDCGQDQSISIIEQMQKEYPQKIKILYGEQNMGLGAARDRGMKAASGEYIAFIDSDDYLKRNFLETYMHRLKFDNDTLNKVKVYVRYHDLRPELTEKSVRRAVSKVGADAFAEVLKLKMADTLAQSPKWQPEKKAYLKELTALYHTILEKQQCLCIKDLKISGKDLIEDGMKPGKEMGEILAKLLELVLEEPQRNEREWLIGKSRELRNTEG